MPSAKHFGLALAVMAMSIPTSSSSKLSGAVVTEELCLTKMGPESQRHVPTYTYDTTEYYTVTHPYTKRSTTTITPRAKTVTQTISEAKFVTVSGRAPTDVVEVEVLTTLDITQTMPPVTSSVTTTSVLTSTVGTISIIPTGSWFSPIQISVKDLVDGDFQHKRNMADNDNKKSQGGLLARARDFVTRQRRKLTTSEDCEDRFPQVVECEEVVLEPTTKTITKSAGAPETITAPTPIVMSTETCIHTITSTTYGPTVTTHVTSTSTATLLTKTTPIIFTTFTSTAVSTAYVATTTSWDMCGRDNYGDNWQNYHVAMGTAERMPNPSATATPVVARTAQDKVSCCNVCAQQELCQVGNFDETGTCNLWMGPSNQLCSNDDGNQYGPCRWELQVTSTNLDQGDFFNGRSGQFHDVSEVIED